MKETISIKIFNTLKQGKEKLNKDALFRVKDFVESQRLSDGSFVNKNRKSDIYYTAFGWMLSYVFGMDTDCNKTASYLKKQDIQQLDLIHYAAYIRCRMIQHLFEGGTLKLLLNSFSKINIRPRSSFDNVPHNDIESPYTQFMWLSLLEDTHNPIQNRDAILVSLQNYHVSGGGYSNMKDGVTAATNASSAALSVIGQLTEYKYTADLNYLLNIQSDTGGFAATEHTPLPDILSTATALFVLNCYNKKPSVSPADFLEAHWLDDGGFASTLLEETSDVEYTFYGLLALGT